jgi:hypothetical protein
LYDYKNKKNNGHNYGLLVDDVVPEDAPSCVSIYMPENTCPTIPALHTLFSNPLTKHPVVVCKLAK